MTLLLLACMTATPGATHPPFDPAVAAWSRAGADVGWIAPERGRVRRVFTDDLRGFDSAEAVPAFRFREPPRPGVLEKLPEPRGPFGVCLAGDRGDATPAALARFGRLTALVVNGTPGIGGLKRLARSCPLTTLSVWLFDDGTDRIAAVASVGTLRHLHLEFAHGGQLAALAPLRLSSLSLHVVKATDAELKNLAALRALRQLTLEADDVGDEGVRHLAGLAGLEVLRLRSRRLTDAALSHLSGLKRLRDLDLSDSTGLGGRGGLSALVGLPLTTLNISNTAVSDDDMKAVAAMAGLDDLSLYFTKVGEAGYARLTALKRLRHLDPRGNSFTDACAAHVAKITTLRTLTVDRSPLTDAAVRGFADLRELRTLWLSFTRVTDACAADLARLPELRHLDLCGTSFTDAGVRRLSPMRRLRSLDLSRNDVTDAAAAAAARIEGLTWLNLSMTNAGDAGLHSLRSLRGLTHLDVHRTKATADAVAAFRAARPQCRVKYE